MNLHFQGLYPREISLVIIGLILTVSFPIVEATDLTDFNLSDYVIQPTPEDHIGIITTDKSVYYVGGDANAILAYGVIPIDMPICPSPYGCEGYGPSIGIYDPNGNRKITLQHVPYPYDGALKVEDRNFWSSINRFGPLIAGCWELKLYSGVHLSGTLLDTRSFLVTESGNEVTELCEEEPPSDPPPTNNEKIVFSSTRSASNSKIFVINADGTNELMLSNTSYDERHPTWSTDGTKIAYTRFTVNNEIFIMNADGTNPTNISNNPALDTFPHFSSENNKIVFHSDRAPHNSEIYVMNADGTNPTNISNTNSADGGASWSPNGNKIVFQNNRNGALNNEIYVMNADGSCQTNLSNSVGQDLHADWSPDGTKIAFSSTRDGNFEIYVMNADGTNQTNISNNPSVDRMPSWSSDGAKIVFNSKRDGNYEIYVMNADGTNQTNISNNPFEDVSPDWQSLTYDNPSIVDNPLVCNSTPDQDPTVSIISPDDFDVIDLGNSTTFSGSATDPEDGDISNIISWNSSIDGELGVASSLTNSFLSLGNHTITASVTDSAGNVGSDSIIVNVLDSGPDVWIISPSAGDTYVFPASINFNGTATDTVDGDITASIIWTSDIDNYIGASGFFAKPISVGIHNITASVTDSFGNTASLSHIITVTPVDAIPTISIASPINGSSFVEGIAITFTGTATDPEDGDLTDSLFWWSDLGGGLVGTGGSFVNSSLPVGTHFITATAQDSASQTGSSMHIITVTPVVVDNPPTVNIVTPSDGESIINGTLVTFSATATDVEDGDLAETLKWYSDLDGFFGASGSILYDTASLSNGTHTITANVTDSATNTNSDYITITITEDSYTMIQICHIPPDNPDNPQTISIADSAWLEHETHGDTLGECNDNIIEINPNDDPKPEDESTKIKKEHKKEMIIEEIKKQKENAKKKSELNSYRDDFNKIKTELKLFKEQGKNTDSLRSKIKSIISDFQKTLKILTAEFEYDKEYKSELRAELKEKNKALYEKMTKSEQVFNSKVSSKLSELSQSIDPAKTAKDLGLDYKNGKTTITISLTNVNQNILDKLGSIGRIDAVADNYVQLTVNLKNLKDLGSVPGVKSITPSYSAVQSTIQKSENEDRELGSVDLLNEIFTSIQGHFRGIFS